jgi:hypothetical protein
MTAYISTISFLWFMGVACLIWGRCKAKSAGEIKGLAMALAGVIFLILCNILNAIYILGEVAAGG